MPEKIQGAESKIVLTDYLGKDAIIKIRLPKRYRHSELDNSIRLKRLKNEAKLLREVKLIGIRTPFVYDIDINEYSITMERISGITVKEALDDSNYDSIQICKLIGETIGILHNNKMSHGDLTTSNMLFVDDALCLIDMSMGNSVAELEDVGVDLRLLERSFTSAHPMMEKEYEELLESYYSTVKDKKSILKKVEEIKNRGRYT